MANLIIIFTIIGGLILFAWQNFSPALALNFLGWQLATLPLSVWILIAIAAGFFSAILISSFFQVFQSLSKPDYPPSSSSTPASPPPQYNQNIEPEEVEEFDEPNHSQWQVNRPPVTPAVEPQRSNSSNSRILAEDWETDVRPLEPSWSSTPQSTTSESGFNLDKEQRYTSEVEEDEENWVDDDPSQSRPDSMYSYGNRDSSESGVGQSESVYDADYRVIVPPSNTQIQPDDDDDEDWIEDEPEEGPDLRKS
ncbi:MAG: LapA family protein [Microcoleaceae cyanobacterium]